MDWLPCVHVSSQVEDSFGRAVRDQDIDVVRDRLPDNVQLRSRSHVGPVEKVWRVGRGARQGLYMVFDVQKCQDQ